MTMICPPEIAVILLDILRSGLLSIRNSSRGGDASAIEADHLHNLPDLLRDFSRPKLAYYWDVERESFIAQTPTQHLAVFEPLWNKLYPHVCTTRETLSVG